MRSSPPVHPRTAVWVVAFSSPLGAWFLASALAPRLHGHSEIFFVAAALISAAIGGLKPALVAGLMNGAALHLFSFLLMLRTTSVSFRTATSSELPWSLLLITVAVVIGYARTKWWAAEMLAGDLAR